MSTHRPGGNRPDSSRAYQDVVSRVRGEFLEMPGMRLTVRQAQRLWRMDERACDAILGALVESRFLARTRDGAFIRDDGNTPTVPEDGPILVNKA